MNKNQQSYFDCHPHVNEFFFTSDGFAFFNRPDAEAHAIRLQNKEIEHVKRPAKHTITEDDLNNNPELHGQVKAGDEVEIEEESQTRKSTKNQKSSKK